MKIYGLIAAGFIGLMMSGTASAVPCSDLESGIFKDAAHTDPAYDQCVDAPEGNANDQGAGGIVASGFNGFTDWVELAELFDSDSDGAMTMGTFTVDSSWYDYEDVIIVLKNGPTCPDGTRWSAYYLEDGLSGTLNWVYGSGGTGNPSEPNCADPELKELSHSYVYGRGESTQVPEPATVALLGIGLLAVGATRRRRRSV